MKPSILIAVIVACALSAPIVSAQERPASTKTAINMNMEKHMGQMQKNMQVMQAQMDKIHNTTDTKERQELMQAHMQAMQENMQAMHGMGGPMMMGAQKGGMKDGDMMKRYELMEKRIDMMQMMMEQMMQHDLMMQSMPTK